MASDTDIEALQLAVYQMDRALGKVKAERDRERDKQISEMETRLNDKFGQQISEAQQSVRVAQVAYTAALDARALSGEGAPHPIGTQMAKWEIVCSGRKRIVTTGILEVVTSASKFASNLASYSIPQPGSFIIRLYRKDGTLGSKFVTFRNGNFGWLTEEWLPEGVAPSAESSV